MKKTTKLTAMLLAAACSLVMFAGCPGKKDPTATTTAASTGETPAPDFTGRLSGYTVVYPGFSAASIRDNATKLAKLIGCEAKADKGASGDYADDGGLEILVGDTNRPESAAAKDALTAAGSKRAYNYSVTIADNNRIVIVGDKPDAVAQALSDIAEKYIEKRDDGSHLLLAKGQTISDGYDLPVITASNGVRFRTELISQIYTPRKTPGKEKGCQYPKVIELQHNGEYNGMLIATYESDDSGFRVSRSTDGGQTWKPAMMAVEKMDSSLTQHWEPHLFELPCQVGDMPEGTILLSGTTISRDLSTKSHVTIWRSFNQGRKWEQYSIVAEAGGLGEGLWEPCILYENGYLYCFYSDDSDPKHDQKLVYKKSKDGIRWTDFTECVAMDDPIYRPGMISVVKMNNGKFFASYELLDGPMAEPHTDRIYYKVVDTIDGDWNPSDPGKLLVPRGGENYIGSAPWCGYLPGIGENGIVFVTANRGGNKFIYISFDYGETFEAIENPLPYVDRNTGYSPSFFASADGKTLFYAQTVPGEKKLNKIMFAKIRIEEAFELK